MAWNLTAVAARAGSTLRLRRPWPSSPVPAAASSDVFARVAHRAATEWGAADQKALEVAFDEIGGDAPVLRRAIATGAHVGAVASFAGAWSTLDEAQRSVVRNPLGRTGVGPVALTAVPARQVDATTCGPASLAMMLMMGDPFVALWVVTGRHVGEYVPLEPLVTEIVTREIRTVEERWRSLQRELHREATRWAFGPFPWPRKFGTPPWRIDDAIRFAGLRFRGRLIDDRNPAEVAGFIAHAKAAVADGIPVPLYAGGDSSRGWQSVVPRHVVLLVGREGPGFLVYEPGAGRVVALPDSALHARNAAPHPALGNWSRATWAVLPRSRSRVRSAEPSL